MTKVLFINTENRYVCTHVKTVEAIHEQGSTYFTFNHEGNIYTFKCTTDVNIADFLKSSVLDFTAHFELVSVGVPVTSKRQCDFDDVHRAVAVMPSTGRVQLVPQPISIRFPF